MSSVRPLDGVPAGEKLWLGLPATPPDDYTGPWQRQEQWAVWVAGFWLLLCVGTSGLAAFSDDPFIVYLFTPSWSEILFRLNWLPLMLLIFFLFGLAVDKGGVNVAYTRKASHILANFLIPLLLVPAAIDGNELYRQWYLSATWYSLLGFVLPYVVLVQPIRSRVRLFYLGHRSFDRPEDRPYTLIWFMTQMLAIGLILTPMMQYFVSEGAWSLYLIAAMANGLGDGLAEPIGKIFGKKHYEVRALFTQRRYTRTYVGSACVAFFTALGVLINMPILTIGETLSLLVILPPLITWLEAKSPHTWDNVFLYLACWLVIYLVVLA